MNEPEITPIAFDEGDLKRLYEGESDDTITTAVQAIMASFADCCVHIESHGDTDLDLMLHCVGLLSRELERRGIADVDVGSIKRDGGALAGLSDAAQRVVSRTVAFAFFQREVAAIRDSDEPRDMETYSDEELLRTLGTVRADLALGLRTGKTGSGISLAKLETTLALVRSELLARDVAVPVWDDAAELAQGSA